MIESYKVCLLGGGRVGKTSLIRRFIEDDFSESQQSTVQATTHISKLMTIDDKQVKLEIWDTAGQEKFRALVPVYLRKADGVLVLYDITDKESFEDLRNIWISQLKSVEPEAEIVIVGNKCDLERNRRVNGEEVLEYCKSLNARHILASAKLSKNVNECFMELARRMVQNREKKEGPKKPFVAKRGTIRIEETSSPDPKKKCCD